MYLLGEGAILQLSMQIGLDALVNEMCRYPYAMAIPHVTCILSKYSDPKTMILSN